MPRRILMLLICGLASLAAHSQSEPPLAVEFHLGTADGGPSFIWIPKSWSKSVGSVRVQRRMVGETKWQELKDMQYLGQRDRLMLEHAKPADLARLREELLSDSIAAWKRGFAYGEDASDLPKGDIEYGVFVRAPEGDFLEQPLATAIWSQPPPREYDAGMKPLGVFRDANGVVVQVAVDPRRMLSWAVGVRMVEHRNGFATPALYPLQVPARRDGWTAFCHRLKEPLPTAVTFRLEDSFGDNSTETVEIDPTAVPGKPPLDPKACMPVRPSLKPAYKLPPARLSKHLDLLIGAKDYKIRVLWIPKTWPAGMEGVQIMRRAAGEAWTEVGDVMRPGLALRSRLERAKTPQDFSSIREELRGSYRHQLVSSVAMLDEDSDELLDGVVEYGAFPVISGQRASEPAATSPWLVGNQTELSFGLTEPRLLRGKSGLVGVTGIDIARFQEQGSRLRLIQVNAGMQETLYAEVAASARPMAWKTLCVPIELGKTQAVKIIVQHVLGYEYVVSRRINAIERIATDTQATAQCLVPPAAE